MRIAEKKKSQIAALYEQCSGLPADVRSCLENGYFTVTVPPPWNMSNQKVAQEVQDKIKEWSRQYRLERLYNVMQKTRHTAEGEKEELQSLVSDISHQTKTPIANLKLINDTMLTRPLTEEKRKEFLQATGTQLDKLDFLIQGMVKTSRLETGVITLEKQDAVIGDTLVSAINGVLAPMEQKEISLSVDCPSDLTISHDSRWTSEALFNILDNAVKYTSAGGSIQVRVRDFARIQQNMDLPLPGLPQTVITLPITKILLP